MTEPRNFLDNCNAIDYVELNSDFANVEKSCYLISCQNPELCAHSVKWNHDPQVYHLVSVFNTANTTEGIVCPIRFSFCKFMHDDSILAGKQAEQLTVDSAENWLKAFLDFFPDNSPAVKEEQPSITSVYSDYDFGTVWL